VLSAGVRGGAAGFSRMLNIRNSGFRHDPRFVKIRVFVSRRRRGP